MSMSASEKWAASPVLFAAAAEAIATQHDTQAPAQRRIEVNTSVVSATRLIVLHGARFLSSALRAISATAKSHGTSGQRLRAATTWLCRLEGNATEDASNSACDRIALQRLVRQ